MKRVGKLAVFGAALAAVLVPFLISAQEFPSFRGGGQRTGKQTGDIAQTTPGRAFLRWWDPISSLDTYLDNWETPNASGSPFGAWLSPTGIEAFNADEKNPQANRAPYLYSPTVASSTNGNDWEPANGTANTFTWRFPGLGNTQEVALYVNLPVGPTDVDASAATSLWYPQQYFIYRIDGVVNPENPGQPIYDRVDTYAGGGGRIRLGNGGSTTDRVFVTDAVGTVTITLINTVPRDGEGRLTDTRPNILVYADSALAVRSTGSLGTYQAQPVVSRLRVNPGTVPWRVFAGRNEPTTVQSGSEILTFNLGILSSYQHNGLKVDATEPGRGGDIQRNLVWSWPARKVFDDTTTEVDRYTNDKRNFILGLIPTVAGSSPTVPPARTAQIIGVDNISPAVTVSSGWNPTTTIANYKGTNLLAADVVVGPSTARATYRPSLPEGQYRLDVWCPGGLDVASGAQVEIFQGGVRIGTATVDQSLGARWVRLLINGNSEFDHTNLLPLSVAITNASTVGADAGLKVAADYVRFTRQADLSISSTPVTATVNVSVAGIIEPRDVIVVPMENGRLYCLDAKGNVDGLGNPTGTTQVYWVYPSELPTGTADPNQTVAFDGTDGLATMPTEWDMSSATIQSVRTGPNTSDVDDILYVGSANGRVYAISMTGRGDGTASRYGTTTRRWSFPDDYPSAASTLSLGPIVGSVSYEVVTQPSGVPLGVVYVPTVSGRIYALDAAGDNATKKTSIIWQYPAANQPGIGAIRMTPAIEFGRLYLGTGQSTSGAAVDENTFMALNLVDAASDGVGDVVWRSTEPFGAFDTSSPATVRGTVLGGSDPNTVYVANNAVANGASTRPVVFAIDADTGATVWRTSELGSDVSGSLVVTFLNTYQNNGQLDYPPLTPPIAPLPQGRPVVIAPLREGRYAGLYARLTDVNRDSVTQGLANSDGLRYAWGYFTEGTTAVSPALGGFIAGGTDPTDEEHSWIYGADSLGYLYAFSYDPDYPDNDQSITPGTPPGREDLPPNDPTATNLRDIVANARVSLLTPKQYEDLLKKLREGTLTYNDVRTQVDQITRRHWDYGETLYIVVWDLKDPGSFAPAMNYSLELQFSSPGTASQRRVLAISRAASRPNTAPGAAYDHVAFTAFPILGTGNNALSPGGATVSIRAQTTRITSTGAQGTSANLTIGPSRWIPASPNLTIANPIAISTVPTPTSGGVTSLGYSLDPTNGEVQFNGNQVADGIKNLAQPFGPDAQFLGDFVAHGQSAVSRMFVWDRSLIRLLLGEDKGLQNVRFLTNELQWVTAGNAANSLLKSLNTTQYPNFEQLPGAEPNNTSPDYPNLRREAYSVTKDTFGNVENPLFSPVGLEPPTYTSGQFDAYRTDVAIYNRYMDRNLQRTVFDLALNVPRFQPPNRNGYSGEQVIFVDANQAGRQFTGTTAQEAFRSFFSTARVAVDERIRVGTPTVDLGAVPAGAGFAPTAPWNNNGFRLDDPLYHSSANPFFQRFTVLNEGNVNLVNVRVAKTVVGSPFLSHLSGEGQHENAWLDSALHLHSDIDPVMLSSTRFPYLTPLSGRAMVQKPRVGDVVPTTLRVNPARRDNPNIGAIAGTLIPAAAFPSQFAFNETVQDPRVAVSAPIGAPVGNYRQQVLVFEDRGNSLASPELGPETDSTLYANPSGFEPYSDPGFNLKFRLRETRLTNRATGKAAPVVDDPTALGITSNNPFQWSNQQPTGFRDLEGNLITVWASNRLQAGTGGGIPGFTMRPRVEGDSGAPDQWRLYGTVLAGRTPASGIGTSPFADLNGFVPATATRWARQSLDAFPNSSLPATSPRALFGLAANEDVSDRGVRYGNPSFPASGIFDPLAPMTAGGRTNLDSIFMAFTGEILKQTAQGTVVTESRLFIAPVTSRAGNVGAGTPVPLSFTNGGNTFGLDPSARLSRPSVVQTGNDATVFFASSAAGQTQINWARYSGGAWVRMQGQPVENLRLGTAFESVGAPSAILRRRTGAGSPAAIQLSFTAKLRGRPTSEVYFGTLNANAAGAPVRINGIYDAFWATRTDRLVQDAASTVFWAPGAEWKADSEDLNFGTARSIDILWLDGTGNVRSAIDHATKHYNAESRIMTADTVFGGKAVIDLAAGSIRFTGGFVPRSAVLQAKYTPRYVRISSGAANYRGAMLLFDERFAGELSYWASSDNRGARAGDAIRNDRFWFTYGRTSVDGVGASRPYLQTYRFGVQLPYAILQDLRTGNLVDFQISGLNAGTFYQVDPVRGRVYTSGDNEGRTITIRYRAVDENGNPINGAAVQTIVTEIGLVGEAPEQAIPIDQVGNESSVYLTMDPQNGAFTSPSNGRPPLVWMLWSSTRAGVPDVFFQTMAPRFTALPPSTQP